jgi:hypothetical protein
MYYDDHLPAHFHVAYSEEFAKVGIDPITILAGALPRSIRRKCLSGQLSTSLSCERIGSLPEDTNDCFR